MKTRRQMCPRQALTSRRTIHVVNQEKTKKKSKDKTQGLNWQLTEPEFVLVYWFFHRRDSCFGSAQTQEVEVWLRIDGCRSVGRPESSESTGMIFGELTETT